MRGDRHATRTRELSATHGYDTKYAMHALRIGHQGIELLQTGRISLPVAEPDRTRLRAVRAGEPPLSEILEQIEDATERLRAAADAADLPPDADLARIDEFLGDAYRTAWAARAAR